MSMRSTFGILALTGLLASSSASVLGYRVTGTFDDALGDYDSLRGTSFVYDFSYDTDAANLGDVDAAYFTMNYANLQTDMGSASSEGGAIIDLDPEFGSIGFWGTAIENGEPTVGYGLIFSDLPPLHADLPGDLTQLATDHAPAFYMTGLLGVPNFGGVGYAYASNVNVQSVPEPATMAVLAVGVVGLARRRRSRQA